MRQIELLRFTVDVLDRLEISYAVVGSFASGAWGEPRMTRDIDILIQLPVSQIEALCAAFPPTDFYVSRTAAAEAAARHGQFNVIHPASGNKIDFMVAGTEGWPTDQLARRKKVVFDADTVAYVASPEDVILGKLIYYLDGKSEKHLRDIAGILAISGGNLDRDYIARHATALGVEKIWQAVVDRVENRGAGG